MSLPQSVIDSIFKKLSVTYGHRFSSIWDGLPIENVKADWAQTLEGTREDRILWALQNLPERAPDAPTFRELCKRMPQLREPMFALPDMPKQPAPEVSKAFAEAIKNETPAIEPKRVTWARGFIAQWTAPGAHPTMFQREVLNFAKRIVERHDAPPANLDAIKAETQERVDTYAEEDKA